MYTATLDTDHEVIVKFTACYNEAAHRVLADTQLAPTVTISFSYAYHNWTNPTFSLRTLDVTMTSL